MFGALVVDSHGCDIEGAIERVKNFVDDTRPIYYVAEQDETLLVNNCTYLHGRTGLSPQSPRVVWRAWIR